MTTAAISGKGTVLNWNSAPVEELLTTDTPNENSGEYDVTSHATTGRYREFIAGLIDSGEFPFECNRIAGATVQEALITDKAAGTVRAWSIVFPDTGNYTVSGTGFVKSIRIPAPVDGALKMSGTIRATGAISYTA